jgi:hypothetical protein
MSSIMQNGDTFHGISVFGRGVFTHDTYGWNYAGQCKDGHACGLGVLTDSFFGNKEYAEHGPDGQFDGRFLGRNATGDTWYQLFERGRQKVYALVFADGLCQYNFVACAPDDPRLLALIAQVDPVEVRRAAPAPDPPSLADSPPSNRPMRRFVLPPQALAKTVATEVQSHAARRRWWPCDTIWQRPQCKVRPRSDAFARRFDMGVAREARPDAPFCTLTNAVACTPMVRPGSFVAKPCHALCLAKHCLAFPCTRHTSVALPSFTAPLSSGPDASRAGFAMRA